MDQHGYFNRISILLLFFALMLLLTSCDRQMDGVVDAAKVDTKKADTGHGQKAAVGQDREGQSSNDGMLRQDDTETEQQEPVTEYPILTKVNSRWVDYVMESEGIYCVYVDLFCERLRRAASVLL